ncbi:MAG: NAD-dependent deacetylase [Actinomycetota bacterium]|nr:NAD-dependent deacetylase [Actinomycetota bacterium]
MTGPASVDHVAGWVEAASTVTVLTGAGISTASGIPDFRGPAGVWTRNPGAQRMFDLQTYLSDPDVRRVAWRNRAEHPAWTAEPNAGHRALVDLERTGRLRALVTQNIDGLHQRAGSSPGTVVEIHGTLFEVECLSCGRATPMREALDRVAAGDPDPACTVCGGIQKSATISFGQSLRPEVLAAAAAAARDCELFLAVGTLLTVQPAAGLAGLAVRAGARLVVVNRDPTPYDDMASAVLREPIEEVLPRLMPAPAPT